jgi:hypothetical protein
MRSLLDSQLHAGMPGYLLFNLQLMPLMCVYAAHAQA